MLVVDDFFICSKSWKFVDEVGSRKRKKRRKK
jgi:hypothetical protein